MSEKGLIFKIVKGIEAEFKNIIAYAYLDSNDTITNSWWLICINNFRSYYSNEFKNFSNKWREIANKKGVKIVFCYCDANEKKLIKLAESDNLIMNV